MTGREERPEDNPERGLSLERSQADLAEVEDQLRVIRDDEGRVAAQEILQTISRLMGTLDTERKVVLMAEEHRRDAEIENARLQAELRMEKELRGRAEAELAQLKGEIEQRQRRAEAELDRLAGGHPRGRPESAAPEQGEASSAPAASESGELEARRESADAVRAERVRTERAEAELQRSRTEARERRRRALEELERRRAQGASEEALQRFREGLERLLGEELDVEPGREQPERPHTVERSLESIWTPRPPGGPQEELDRPQEEEEAPPLPPGWRYASELPAEDKRRRWGRRRRARR